MNPSKPRARGKVFPERYVPADGSLLVDPRLGYLIAGFTAKGDVARPGERFYNAMWSRDHRRRRPAAPLAMRLRLPRLRLRTAARTPARPARALPRAGARMTALRKDAPLASALAEAEVLAGRDEQLRRTPVRVDLDPAAARLHRGRDVALQRLDIHIVRQPELLFSPMQNQAHVSTSHRSISDGQSPA